MHVPTREEFAEIAARARLAGRQATLKRYEELSAESNPQNFYGGAYLQLSIDGRSKLGQFFSSLAKNPLPNVRVSFWRRKTYSIWIEYYDYNDVKEWSSCLWLAESAVTAARKVFEESLGIKIFIRTFSD
jgi:hypothetical protein